MVPRMKYIPSGIAFRHATFYKTLLDHIRSLSSLAILIRSDRLDYLQNQSYIHDVFDIQSR